MGDFINPETVKLIKDILKDGIVGEDKKGRDEGDRFSTLDQTPSRGIFSFEDEKNGVAYDMLIVSKGEHSVGVGVPSADQEKSGKISPTALNAALDAIKDGSLSKKDLEDLKKAGGNDFSQNISGDGRDAELMLGNLRVTAPLDPEAREVALRGK